MITRAPSGYDANLKWTASAGAVAYRIFWRGAWGPDWEHDMLVGKGLEFGLGENFVFQSDAPAAPVGTGKIKQQ